jgi:hypothetical protein
LFGLTLPACLHSIGEQVGIQVDEELISGAGNEVLSVSVPLIDNNISKIEGSNSQQVHYGYFTTIDDGNNLCFCRTGYWLMS